MTIHLTDRRTRIAARAREEHGFGLVELIVALFILVLGLLAVFGLFDSATRGSYRAEQTQVALDRAQSEMEQLRSLPWIEVAMTSRPLHVNDPRDPRFRVTLTNDQFALTWDRASQSTGDLADMVVNGDPLQKGGTIAGGTVNPGPQRFTSGDVSGSVFRFVTWRDDPGCSEDVCPGTQDYKRVVVAVRLDTVAASYDKPYVEIASDFYDPDSGVSQPDEGGSGNPPPGGGPVTQSFWLSDTPCGTGSGSPARQPISDHLLHNTQGTCADGLQTGRTSGAPDALMMTPPPDPFPNDPDLPATFDYSTDPYLEPTPNQDRGLQILRGAKNGCNYSPNGANPEAQVHRWLTRPVPSTYRLEGSGTVTVYSRSINNAIHHAKVCVFPFIRSQSGTDTVLGAFTWDPPGNSHWPFKKWELITIPLRFTGQNLNSGDRIGVALSVERSQTPADGLQFLYDHPEFPSRMDVRTTTPMPIG